MLENLGWHCDATIYGRNEKKRFKLQHIFMKVSLVDLGKDKKEVVKGVVVVRVGRRAAPQAEKEEEEEVAVERIIPS